MTRGLIFALMASCALHAGAAQAEVERFTVVANGEKVGALTADHQAQAIALDYAVSDNGRGAKSKERLVLDARGLPTQWRIDGSSLFGAPVSERFDYTGGQAAWSSLADNGRVTAPKVPLYLAADTSPYALYVYAQALLKAPDHTLAALPSGVVRLNTVRAKVTLGAGAKAIDVSIYEMIGLTLDPAYVVIDSKGQFFGTLDGLIREGYEGDHDQLQALGGQIALERAADLQKALAHRISGPIRIRNVRVFDPKTMALGPISTVMVFGDKITSVTPGEAPEAIADETVIDGQGGALIPGLHDMHSHTTLQSNLFNLAAGVLATRDQGNDNDRLLDILGKLKAGEIAGPRIVPNGFLEGRSPYSEHDGFVIDSLPEALERVRWYADHGYFQIKIYNSMNPDWVAPIAAEAHRLGMGVTGHVPAFSNADRVLREGYDDIAHLNQLMLGWMLTPTEDTRTPLRLTAMVRATDLDLNSPKVQSTVAYMETHHKALDTTAVILERIMLTRPGEVYAGDKPFLDHTPVGYQRSRKRGFLTLQAEGDQTDARYRAAFQKTLQVVKLLDSHNIQLLPGTDETIGFALLRELELYVQAGIPAGKTLRLATLDSERYFGRDQQLGSIERGKLADLILVAADPVADIRNIRQVRMSMVGGVVYFPAEIYRQLGVEPLAPPPPMIPPRAQAQ